MYPSKSTTCGDWEVEKQSSKEIIALGPNLLPNRFPAFLRFCVDHRMTAIHQGWCKLEGGDV